MTIRRRPLPVRNALQMGSTERENTSSPSTTSAWKWVKVRRPAGGPSSAATKSASRQRLSAWNRREPLTVTVTYRGGAECWIELKARGKSHRMPGSVALFDALCSVWE